MKRLVMMMLVLVAVGGTTEVSAQSWLKKLGKKVENAAKNAVERNAERKTEKAVDDLFDGKVGKGNKNNNGNNNNADEVYDNGNGDATAQSGSKKQAPQMSWNKFDFVSGDEIIFEDNQANEQLGEFPSQWDMSAGNVEIAQMDADKVIVMYNSSEITPLMKEGKNYLPEMFTVELDVWVDMRDNYPNGTGTYKFNLKNEKDEGTTEIYMWNMSDDGKTLYGGVDIDAWSPSGEHKSIDENPTFEMGWNRLSISFNKRALKIYINSTRVANIPNVAQANWFEIQTTSNGSEFYVKNVRIAKGAVPLYDRMMSDGKFITYGITFDVGKSTIKPESMGEINRIVQLMTENPDLKFSVEGHTDSTGNPTSNQILSEQRSQAIVAKLVELGIASDRLTAVGKGQNSPIADNNTDEGRAKNRRVEFVKM